MTKNSPFAYHLTVYIFATKALIDSWKKSR